MTRVEVVEGDITTIPADALITTTNSHGSVILSALNTAEAHQLSHVTIPIMRTGSAHGRYSEAEDSVGGMITALQGFLAANPSHIQLLQVVVYKNPKIVSRILQGLA